MSCYVSQVKRPTDAGLRRRADRIETSKLNEMVVALFESSSEARSPVRALSETDAVDIWIARWLNIRRRDLVARYGCDPRRLYEIWEGRKHPAARELALKRFEAEFPGLLDRVDFGPHRRVPRDRNNPDQLPLFGDDNVAPGQ